MVVTKEEYKVYADVSVSKQVFVKNCIMAFVFGGLICDIGQLFLNLYIYLGMPKDIAAISVTITMIFIGAFLTGIDVYDGIGKYGGAGTIVPITGFANSIVSPAMEFKKEGYVFGLGAKMFIIAGPVLVYGISTSVLVGFIYYILEVIK